MPIERLYLSDVETNDPTVMLELVVVLDNGERKRGRDTLHLSVVKNTQSTFTKTEFVVANANPDVDSDSNFEHNQTMFTLDLDEVIEALTLLKKRGV